MTERTNENIRYTLATHSAEHMSPSREAISFCKQIADGRMTGDQAVAQIKRLYGIELGANHA